MSVRILVGDCMQRLRDLPDESVHCCVTSPPYWGLRSYDDDALRIDPSLDAETREWLLGELNRRRIHAR